MRVIRRLLILIGLTVLLVWLLLPPPEPSIEDGSILVLDVSGAFVEATEPSLVARLLGERRKSFAALLSELKKAERDDRLAAVLLRVRNTQMGWAKAQELRDAIADLRESGRRTAAYLEVASFGANLEYYVASAAESIYEAPGARSPLVGLAAEFLFLGGFWEKLGIGLEVERIGPYKTAADFLAGREMSDAHREMSEALLDSIDSQFVRGIAEGRDLEPDFVRRAIDGAPSTPQELEALGLIDGALFEDEVIETLGGGKVVRGPDYARIDPTSVGFAPVAQLALVYGSGNVVLGSGSFSRTGQPVLASDTVSKALVDAAEDPEIDGIIFRIDSPGGSALASDVVWRATQRVREEGKPLIASFSDVAASGGYYVAAGSDAIVASPGSITGSIGVFVLRPVLRDLLERLDIGVETMTRGAHADLLLSSQPLSPASRERLSSEVRSIYDQFVGRVADGRPLSPEEVDGVGQGRVWTGEQAAEIGLVDALGGLRVAVLRAKRALALDPDDDVVLIPYPTSRSLREQIDDLLRRVAVAVVPRLPLPPLAARVERWLESVPIGAPALVPPFVVEIR